MDDQIFAQSFFIQGVVALTLAIISFLATGPFGNIEYDYFRRSRALLGTLFLSIAICLFTCLISYYNYPNHNVEEAIIMTTITVDLFLIAVTYIPLIDHEYFKKQRIYIYMIKAILYAILTIPTSILAPDNVWLFFCGVSTLWYYVEALQIVYTCHSLHKKAYKNIKDNSSDIQGHLNWILISFNLYLITGMIDIIICHFGLLAKGIVGMFMIVIMLYTYVLLQNYGSNLPLTVKNIKQRGESVSYSHVKLLAEKWIEEKGWTENGLTTDILAIRFGSNRKYITKYFAEEKGMTFRAFINSQRIEEAKTLLATSSMSVEDLSNQLGFSSRNQFATIFSNSVGMTPSQYRASANVQRRDVNKDD